MSECAAQLHCSGCRVTMLLGIAEDVRSNPPPGTSSGSGHAVVDKLLSGWCSCFLTFAAQLLVVTFQNTAINRTHSTTEAGRRTRSKLGTLHSQKRSRLPGSLQLTARGQGQSAAVVESFCQPNPLAPKLLETQAMSRMCFDGASYVPPQPL